MSRLLLLVMILVPTVTFAQETSAIKLPRSWTYSAPLISPEAREEDPSHAQKDPTVVYHDGKWNVFMTAKLAERSVIEYCSFAQWEEADAAPRTILAVSDSDYYCAPQVVFFTPHNQ